MVVIANQPDTPCLRDIDSPSASAQQIVNFAPLVLTASRYLSDGGVRLWTAHILVFL